MTTNIHRAGEEVLRRMTGDPAATFRPGQWEAIQRLVEHRGRVLVVQRTGWGKSAVYFTATRLLRDQGAGVTMLVSPLLALMRNQISMAERAGLRAVTLNSENPDDWEAVEARVRDHDIDLLLISPERLNNARFRREVLGTLVPATGLLVVDEAHCISDWGHDFRPDYRRIARMLRLLPTGVPVLCTTATANDRVVADVVAQLGDDLEVIRGTLDRDSLALAVVDLPEQASRLAWLAQALPKLPGAGIVYCLTVADTARVASWLQAQGIHAVAYSGRSDVTDRRAAEEALLGNRVKAVVATSALGMGFDKPDLGFVVHYQSPGSPIAYYQQVGRAGRALDHAQGILLRGTEDADIQDHFIDKAFPTRQQAEHVIDLLEARPTPVTTLQIERKVRMSRPRVDSMMKLLEVEGAVERGTGGWRRTLTPWRFDEERVRRVTALRRAEQDAMVRYATTGDCRMAVLRRMLDEPAAADCGRCDNCTAERADLELDQTLVLEALSHLRGSQIEIKPRRRWPAKAGARNGRIPDELQVRPGRALGVYGDGGWGGRLRHARRNGATTCPDDLVAATAELVRRWSPAPAPAWVTYVPSTTTPQLLTDLAERVAAALELPLHDVVRRVRAGTSQRRMSGSVRQLRNVDRAFAVTSAVPPGPVLLLDDLVGSRWTLTVVGAELRAAGTADVHPLAVAKAVRP